MKEAKVKCPYSNKKCVDEEFICEYIEQGEDKSTLKCSYCEEENDKKRKDKLC